MALDLDGGDKTFCVSIQELDQVFDLVGWQDELLVQHNLEVSNRDLLVLGFRNRLVVRELGHDGLARAIQLVLNVAERLFGFSL